MQCPEGCSCHHDSSWSQNVIRCSERGLRAVPALIPMDATEVRLDGNAFAGGRLESQGGGHIYMRLELGYLVTLKCRVTH